jgi:hypothetical protein
MSKIVINYEALANLKRDLQNRFIQGCENAVEVIKDVTPIDTQRLYESTRVEMEDADITADIVTAQIVAGGVELYGVRREANILREVDYAIYVERRDMYIQNNLDAIVDAIVDAF